MQKSLVLLDGTVESAQCFVWAAIMGYNPQPLLVNTTGGADEVRESVSGLMAACGVLEFSTEHAEVTASLGDPEVSTQATLLAAVVAAQRGQYSMLVAPYTDGLMVSRLRSLISVFHDTLPGRGRVTLHAPVSDSNTVGWIEASKEWPVVCRHLFGETEEVESADAADTQDTTPIEPDTTSSEPAGS